MSGRVFRRSTVARPAGRDQRPRLHDHRRRGARVSRRCRGRRRRRDRAWPEEVARAAADQLGRSRTHTGRRSPPSPSRGTRSGSGRSCRWRTRRSTRSRGGSEAIETALKLARATQLARGEKDRDRDRPLGELPRQHPRRVGPLGPPPAAPPYEAWLGRFRHVRAAYPYRAGRAGLQAMDDAARSRRSSRAIRGGPGEGRGLRRGADRRGHAGRRRAARRLLAGHRRRLPPPRRATRRRRGHDRVRPGRDVVRDGPLRRRAGPARRGQGRDVRLLAVRLRRGVGRVWETVTRGVGSSTGSRTRTSPVGGRGRPRGPSDPRGGAAGGGLGGEGRAAPRAPPGAPGRPRERRRHPGRGLLAGVELVRDRETKAPFARSQRLVEAVSGSPATGGCSSTRGRATRTASTATSSSSARRSWSRTTSWHGSRTGSARPSTRRSRRSRARRPGVRRGRAPARR